MATIMKNDTARNAFHLLRSSIHSHGSGSFGHAFGKPVAMVWEVLCLIDTEAHEYVACEMYLARSHFRERIARFDSNYRQWPSLNRFKMLFWIDSCNSG